MTLLFIDGADDGHQADKYTSWGNEALNTGRTGSGSSHRFDDYANWWRQKILDAADENATLIVGCAIAQSSTTSGDPVIQLKSDNGATLHVYLQTTTDRRLQVRRGDGTLLAETAAAIWALSTWFYVELKATLHDSTGSIYVQKDGVQILSATGIDTKNGGTKTVFDSFRISGYRVSMDDIYACNAAGSVHNTFLGDCSVQTLLPSGDGNYSQWVGSDGNSVNNSLLVDEPTLNTTDYVESGTSGNKDSYAFADLSGTPSAVLGVATRMYAAKSDSGTQLARQIVRLSGTDYAEAADTALSTGYKSYGRLMELNPATSAAWSVSEVNGAEFGIEAR